MLLSPLAHVIGVTFRSKVDFSSFLHTQFTKQSKDWCNFSKSENLHQSPLLSVVFLATEGT